jgi:hypothetical protein
MNYGSTLLHFSYSGAVTFNPIPATEFSTKCILGSYTRAWEVGHAVLKAGEKKTSPVEAMMDAVDGSRCIVRSGKVRGKRKTLNCMPGSIHTMKCAKSIGHLHPYMLLGKCAPPPPSGVICPL